MKIRTLRIIFATTFASLSALFSTLGFVALSKQRSQSVSYKDWLKNVNDETSLRSLAIPGSHDTLALYSIADLAGQCQSLSLKDQLNLGVRFLDVRLKENKGELNVVHGFIDQKLTFKDVDKTINDFLKANPSEFIIMSVKQEAGELKDFEKALVPFYNNNIYLKDMKTVPSKVGDIRGKVLILSRYENSQYGIPAYDGWQDSTSFTLSNDIYVQDTYKITSKEQKQDEIKKCFNESGHALKINFLSAYRTDSFPPSYSVSAAKDINPWINQEISKYNDRGIVLYDFVNEENMKAFFKEVL